jgi:hypothetical protein
MAEMYPEMLLERVDSEVERRLFEALKTQLPISVIALYSVRWLQWMPGGHDLDSETDFLIIDRDRRMLILEVKGGVLRRDPYMRGWTGESRDGMISRSPIRAVRWRARPERLHCDRG